MRNDDWEDEIDDMDRMALWVGILHGVLLLAGVVMASWCVWEVLKHTYSGLHGAGIV